MSPPDFVLIGAMKCATTSLDLQLGRQAGVCMAEKELGYFADDEKFARGASWYASKFADAEEGVLTGESSTDYAKLPTWPRTVERMHAALPDLKILYVIRHPVDRLVSHYIHDWTQKRISVPLGRAVADHPELVDYGRYAMQLSPYLEAYGPERVLVTFFERLTSDPEWEFVRIARFLGLREDSAWVREDKPANASAARLRKSGLRDVIVWNPVSNWLRRHLVPRRVRDAIKGLWQMKQRPELTGDIRARVIEVFDEDLVELGSRLGITLDCRNWKAVASAAAPEWAE